MTTTNDLIEDWIKIRSTLQRQIQLLELGKMQTGTNILDSTTEDTILRLRVLVGDLNKLLKEYAVAERK